MKHWISLFFFAIAALSANSFELKKRLEKAKKGDYIVTEIGKMTTLIAVRGLQSNSLILEEISAPSESLHVASWSKWILEKAPGHTSWTMLEMDLQSAQVVECYSFSKSSWIRLSGKEGFFTTLLKLPMQPVSIQQQKKIGPPPMEGEPDVRKIWSPPFFFEGKKVESPHFEVFETTWPEDDSELSQQKVSLYFDKTQQIAFPFWVQIETSHITGNLKMIDAGKNLPPYYRTIPRRVPEFVGIPLTTEKALHLNLKSPKYYKSFELYAVDITTKEKRLLPITHSLIDGEGEWKTVAVDLEELGDTLQEGHRYTWLLVPIGHSESYTEMAKPFVWSSQAK